MLGIRHGVGSHFLNRLLYPCKNVYTSAVVCSGRRQTDIHEVLLHFNMTVITVNLLFPAILNIPLTFQNLYTL
jgi:hypothetical protein